MFSKKATKIDKIFTVDLTVITYCQIGVKILSIFVAFSENVNFKQTVYKETLWFKIALFEMNRNQKVHEYWIGQFDSCFFCIYMILILPWAFFRTLLYAWNEEKLSLKLFSRECWVINGQWHRFGLRLVLIFAVLQLCTAESVGRNLTLDDNLSLNRNQCHHPLITQLSPG